MTGVLPGRGVSVPARPQPPTPDTDAELLTGLTLPRVRGAVKGVVTERMGEVSKRSPGTMTMSYRSQTLKRLCYIPR